ncbi:uncharacterized protein V6R79_012805 [Siganus canaliculatus]
MKRNSPAEAFSEGNMATKLPPSSASSRETCSSPSRTLFLFFLFFLSSSSRAVYTGPDFLNICHFRVAPFTSPSFFINFPFRCADTSGTFGIIALLKEMRSPRTVPCRAVPCVRVRLVVACCCGVEKLVPLLSADVLLMLRPARLHPSAQRELMSH